MTLFRRRLEVAKKTKLTRAAVKIGTAMGKADRAAHQIARAGVAAKDELADIAEQIDALKRQLLKTKKRLQRALK
jgi:ribosome-associated translation inhibitor RaiA